MNYCLSKSSRAIDFGVNQKRLYIFLLVFNSNLDPIFNCTVSDIRRLKCRKSTIFPTPLEFWLKFGGDPFGVDPWCWGQPRFESQVHKIVIREIFWKNSNACDHNLPTLQTDGQTTYHGNTELRYASRGKNAKITVLIRPITQFQLHTIGAKSMGAMGGDHSHGQKVVGAMPSSRPHMNFVTSFLKQ